MSFGPQAVAPHIKISKHKLYEIPVYLLAVPVFAAHVHHNRKPGTLDAKSSGSGEGSETRIKAGADDEPHFYFQITLTVYDKD
jgi:hypothetical protein